MIDSCRVFVARDVAQGMAAQNWVMGGDMPNLAHEMPMDLPVAWVPVVDVLRIIAEHEEVLASFGDNLDPSTRNKNANESRKVIEAKRIMLEEIKGQVLLRVPDA